MDEDMLVLCLRNVAKRIGSRPWDTSIHLVLEELADEIEQEGINRRKAVD